MRKPLVFILSIFVFLGCLPGRVLFGAGETAKLRIVSLAPSTTEILFALGLDEEIVGVSRMCRYPARAREKPRAGNFNQPFLEKILLLKPDLIFCAGSLESPAVARLRQLGFKVYGSEPSSFDELFRLISDMGGILDRKVQSEALIAKMKEEIGEIRSRVDGIPFAKRPKVFLEIWHDPLMTAGKKSFINELLTIAGGRNIAGDGQRPFCAVSSEMVILRDPDCIILADMGKGNFIESVKKRFGWDRIAAVKNNRIYGDIDPDLFLHPGPRLLDGLREFHRRLYP